MIFLLPFLESKGYISPLRRPCIDWKSTWVRARESFPSRLLLPLPSSLPFFSSQCDPDWISFDQPSNLGRKRAHSGNCNWKSDRLGEKEETGVCVSHTCIERTFCWFDSRVETPSTRSCCTTCRWEPREEEEGTHQRGSLAETWYTLHNRGWQKKIEKNKPSFSFALDCSRQHWGDAPALQGHVHIQQGKLNYTVLCSGKNIYWTHERVFMVKCPVSWRNSFGIAEIFDSNIHHAQQKSLFSGVQGYAEARWKQKGKKTSNVRWTFPWDLVLLLVDTMESLSNAYCIAYFTLEVRTS